jgi:light-harvesting complex I chlorophyll a/b binding protein 1
MEYYKKDNDFDPLKLLPIDSKEQKIMKTKELNHGRLAMLSIIGMLIQEFNNHLTIIDTYTYYDKIKSLGLGA